MVHIASLSVLVLLLVSAAASEDLCYLLKELPPIAEDNKRCVIEVTGGKYCSEFIDRKPSRPRQCRGHEDPHIFACMCSQAACPDSGNKTIFQVLRVELIRYKMYHKNVDHPLQPCLQSAIILFPGSSESTTDVVGLSSSSDGLSSIHSTPESPSTSLPTSSSAVPESSPSEQTTAQEPMTSEQATDSTSPSQPAVVESSTVDEALDEITSKHPFQSAATTLENNDSTMPFSTSTMTTGAEWEVDADKPTDLTWLYIALGIVLALVLMVAIGGLCFKLGKKSNNDTKQKVERKSKQIQQGPMKGVVPRPADVRINMPEATRPSTPVVVTALPVTDTTAITQHTGTTGTSGTSGTSNTDEDLNTAGSTITECEISTSTTMTEEMTGGSGTDGM